MIRYEVGDIIECPSGIYVIIKTDNENQIPWTHKYEVVSQAGEVKQVKLFELTHRCI